MNKQKLEKAIRSFKGKHSTDPNILKGKDERAERIAYYQSYTPEKIKSMEPEDFYEYLGKLWSMIIWGNKKYIIDKIIADNGIENLKKQIIELLFGTRDIIQRWDNFKVKGMGPAAVSELLAYADPNEYVIFNKQTISCFKYLEIPDMPFYNYQFSGKRFSTACKAAKEIASVLKANGIDDVSLLAVDYFLWYEILPLTEKDNIDIVTATPSGGVKNVPSVDSFVHDEIIEMIVEIGRLLGFESNSEVKVSTGAIVDAVWETKIGNMGRAIYVFEVQKAGSNKSLILNLIKAKNNAAVQAVVAISDSKQIEKIKKEIEGTPLEGKLRTWDYKEVIEVHEALVKAHASINNLKLVPDSFV